MIFVFKSTYVDYPLRLANVEPFLYLRDKTKLVLVDGIFYVCLYLVCKYLIIFEAMFIKDISL